MDWQAIVFLGAYHGINPGMGWLFAVALGMQQGSARGVWRALPPIALGHAGAVAVVLAIAAVARLVVPLAALNVLVAAVLMSMGVYRLWRHRHPRVGGMQVGFRDLTLWSFLMASAHGAGLMVLPFVMPTAATVAAADHNHAHHVGCGSGERRRRRGRSSHGSVFHRDGACRVDRVSKAWSEPSSQGLVQHGLAVGRALVLTGIVVLLK